MDDSDGELDYYVYIKSEAWFKRTEPVRARNGGMCECCDMRYGDSVHHRSYERLGHELDSDLIHVCTPCHKAIHELDRAFVWDSRVKILDELRREARNLKHKDY